MGFMNGWDGALLLFAAFDQGQEPAQAFVEHGGFQAVADRLTFLVRGDQPCLPQQRQVVRHRRLAQRERGGEFARRVVAFSEQVEQAAAGRVVERAEENVHAAVRWEPIKSEPAHNAGSKVVERMAGAPAMAEATMAAAHRTPLSRCCSRFIFR